MKKGELWGMAVVAVGLAGLFAGCSTHCLSCANQPAPVGERWSDEVAAPEIANAPNPPAGVQRTWPYGQTIANPPLQ